MFAANVLNALVFFFLKVIYTLRLENVLLNTNITKLVLKQQPSLLKQDRLTGGLDGIVTSCQLDVIVKTSDNATAAGRMRCRILQSWREAKLHESTGLLPPNLLVPKVFYSSYNALLGEFCIIMERVPGDLLKEKLGNQEQAPHTELPLELLCSLFTEMAKFHTANWNMDDQFIRANAWLKGSEWFISNSGKVEYEQKLAFARTHYQKGMTLRAHLLSPKVRAMLQFALVTDQDNFTKLIHHCQTNIKCLNHGDFHAGNIIVRGGAQFSLLDFTEIGIFDPVYDLAQLLLSDVDGRWYRDSLRPLIMAWHVQVVEQLTEAQANEFTVEVAYQNMLIAGVNRWLYLIGILIGYSAVPDAKISYWVHNLECWIELLQEEVKDYETRLFLKA